MPSGSPITAYNSEWPPTFHHNIPNGWGMQGQHTSTAVHQTSTVPEEQLLGPPSCSLKQATDSEATTSKNLENIERDTYT